MKEIRLHIKSIEEMQSLAYDLTHLLKPTNVLALNGDLGAGKTTFTKGIGKALEIGRVINSPTFTIMKV
jgi:tRNA threonylcarbamoyladenosine biosynthesis protein TsaE